MRSYSRRQRNGHSVAVNNSQVTGASLWAGNIAARGVERRSEGGGVIDLGSSGFDNRFGQVEALESGHVRGEGGVAKVGSLTVSELVGLDD
jgi:hypothetical protein